MKDRSGGLNVLRWTTLPKVLVSTTLPKVPLSMKKMEDKVFSRDIEEVTRKWIGVKLDKERVISQKKVKTVRN